MLNEFRQDPVTGEWVLYATNRAKDHLKTSTDDKPSPIESCPFEDPQKSGNEKPIIMYNKGQKINWQEGVEWTTQVLRNKWPALAHGICGTMSGKGPFNIYEANGFHELVVTRDHERSFAQFTNEETLEVLKCYKERFEAMAKDSYGDFIWIFHNHGKKAGASVYHNHSQILSLPVIPFNVLKSMSGAEYYYNKNKEQVYEAIINWERKENKRIIYENEKFIAFCPYVSKDPYEVKIFPKSNQYDFRQADQDDLKFLAEAINVILAKFYKELGNPDYNFFINTCPITKNSVIDYKYYRWHLEFMPRVTALAGLELGLGVYVNVVDPDEAAEALRMF